MGHRFSNDYHYGSMHEMNHNGVGHKTGENIVVHVCNMLEPNNHHKHINGELHVRKLHLKNGRIKKDNGYTSVEEYNNIYAPKLKNPLR